MKPDQATIEQIERELEQDVQTAIEKVSKIYPLSKFKEIINKGLKEPITDEDQWTFDYESFCFYSSGPKGIPHPSEFAEVYYKERWNK